jgi:hypothetical protein
MCVGFWRVLVLPSPKLQFQLVGIFVETSMNRTPSGAMPVVMFAVKLATRGFITVM